MARINKIDFFSGAFLSYLISNGVKEPTLFEATEKSKVIKFSLRDKDYNAYIKYVGKSKASKQNGKLYTKWDVIFTEKERDYLLTQFVESDKCNLVVLVCANENLKDTYFAILDYKEALKCIGNDDVNTQYRITVKHQKGSNYVDCYGTAVSAEKSIQLKYNFDEFFEF